VGERGIILITWSRQNVWALSFELPIRAWCERNNGEERGMRNIVVLELAERG